MRQIVCQFGTKKCLYLNQNNLNKLYQNISIDFQDLPPIFQLMYVDEQAGQWMYIQNQTDLQKILNLNKKYVLIKILPPIDKNQLTQCSSGIGKIKITQNLKEMIEFISIKHIQRYIDKQMKQKIMLASGMMLQQKIPDSLTKFQSISAQIQQNIQRTQGKSRKKSKISPFKTPLKNSQTKQIQKTVISKINQIFNQITQICYENIAVNMKCRHCVQKQLQFYKIMTKQLIKKGKNYKNNPQQ